MNEQSTQMKFSIGLVTLVGLLMLVIFILLFVGVPTSLKGYNHYVLVFHDAPGVAAGTPVRRSGIRIGEVESLTLDDESGDVKIGIVIDKKYTLHSNLQPVVNTGLLASDTTIDFVPIDRAAPPPVPERGETPADRLHAAAEEEQQPPPAADRKPIPPGSEIPGRERAEIRNLLNRTSELVPETRQTLNDIRRTLQHFERMTPLLEDTITQFRELGKDARATIPQLRRTNDEALAAMRNFAQLTERLDIFVQTNQDAAARAIEGLPKLVDNLNRALGQAVAIMSEENQRNLTATLKNLRVSTEALPQTMKNADELMKESRSMLQRFRDTLKLADEVTSNLQQATKPMAERSEPITRNAQESMEKLNRLMDDLRTQVTAFGQLTTGEGTLRRLASDPAIYNNLNLAIEQLNRSLPRLDHILKDVEVFADKIARHPELLGARGAIAPSAGLKESPSAPPDAGHWQRPGLR